MWCTKPPAHGWPPHSLPGNWYLFLACVGSLLSTAADGLYLAGFNELRVADVRLGSTFLACVCVSRCLAWSICVCVCVCVCTQGNVCPCICECATLCVSKHRCSHLREAPCAVCALPGTCAASDTQRGTKWEQVISSFICLFEKYLMSLFYMPGP